MKTQRDEWVYDFSRTALEAKVRYLVETYEATRADPDYPERDTIKWDRELEKYRIRKVKKQYDESAIRTAAFRPFIQKFVYFDRHLNGMVYQLPELFRKHEDNFAISFSDRGSRSEFCSMSSDTIVDLHFGAAVDGYQIVTRYRYSDDGDRLDNITDWALNKFTDHYGKTAKITKDDIFAYVYAVLHDPVYREIYALNLRREFPRIPFHRDFGTWRDWGQRLLDLHIGYESVEAWPLHRADVPDEKARAAGLAPKTILKADREAGTIRLDSETTLERIPPEVWEYRLGNRSALDWILDQYKEKTPKDPTIREKFNTYRFADYKEQVADLIARVTRVSVETVAITRAMAAVKRDEP